MRFPKFLALLAVVALICFASVAFAQCPGGNCYRQPQFVPVAPAQPIYRAPIRETLYKFLTPQGYYVQGYYRGPAQPVTREQAIRNAEYWVEQAKRLESQAAPIAPPQTKREPRDMWREDDGFHYEYHDSRGNIREGFIPTTYDVGMPHC
jgi:hypothetical protein